MKARANVRPLPPTKEPEPTRSLDASVLFSYEFSETDRAELIRGLRVSTRLSLLAVKGLVKDSEVNAVNPDDLDLIHDVVDLAEQYAFAVERAVQA